MADNSTFPVTEAQLTSLFLQSICYGVLVITFGFCLHSLLNRDGRLKKSSEIHWLMLGVTIFAFILSSFDLALNFYNNLKAFVFYTGKGGPVEVFSKISDWVNVSKSVCLLVQTVLGDAMLVYRCWIVWGRTFRPILLSSTLWLAACSMAIWIIYLMSTLSGHVLITAKQLKPAGMAFWAISIVLNIITTGLLVYRIWSARTEYLNSQNQHEGKKGYRTSSLDHVVRYIIESGLLYTMVSIITFLTVVTSTNASYPIACVEVVIIPIAFNLIIIRTSKIGDDESSTSQLTAGTLQFRTGPFDADATSSTMRYDGVQHVKSRSSLGERSWEKNSP